MNLECFPVKTILSSQPKPPPHIYWHNAETSTTFDERHPVPPLPLGEAS